MNSTKQILHRYFYTSTEFQLFPWWLLNRSVDGKMLLVLTRPEPDLLLSPASPLPFNKDIVSSIVDISCRSMLHEVVDGKAFVFRLVNWFLFRESTVETGCSDSVANIVSLTQSSLFAFSVWSEALEKN